MRDHDARHVLVQAMALYFILAWCTTIVIVALYWVDGRVFSSPHWRVYGAQAIILHSNQLVVPLLVGFWWRYLMNAIIAERGEEQREGAVAKCVA